MLPILYLALILPVQLWAAFMFGAFVYHKGMTGGAPTLSTPKFSFSKGNSGQNGQVPVRPLPNI